MEAVVLGSTGIKVNKNGFGALPIQRVSTEDAVKLARKAYEAGITFFDTARFYTDSEEKLGEAFDGMREKVYIATKTAANNADEFWEQLGISLHNLRTDYMIFISSTIRLSARNWGMEQDFMKQCSKQKHRERSVISVLQTTDLQLPRKRSNPDCTRHYSSRSAIWQQIKILLWWKNAKRQIWALLR